MKIVGKKDEAQSSSYSKMVGIYLLVLALILLLFLNNYNNMIFLCLVTSMGILIVERIVRWIMFKHLPSDLITMHRDHITIKTNSHPRDIRYSDINDIISNEKNGHLTFVFCGSNKIVVKYCANFNYVRKEILDYKKKYYNK